MVDCGNNVDSEDHEVWNDISFDEMGNAMPLDNSTETEPDMNTVRLVIFEG